MERERRRQWNVRGEKQWSQGKAREDMGNLCDSKGGTHSALPPYTSSRTGKREGGTPYGPSSPAQKTSTATRGRYRAVPLFAWSCCSSDSSRCRATAR